MLLEVQKHLTTGRVGHFYGQENNATTYNLARMNMLMHGVDYQHFDIYKGDTLREDKYGDVKMTKSPTFFDTVWKKNGSSARNASATALCMEKMPSISGL